MIELLCPNIANYFFSFFCIFLIYFLNVIPKGLLAATNEFVYPHYVFPVCNVLTVLTSMFIISIEVFYVIFYSLLFYMPFSSVSAPRPPGIPLTVI
jgi:hypothetical protein